MSTELQYLTYVALLTGLMWIPYILNLVSVRGARRGWLSREPAAARRLERVLSTDPGMGVVRHADAGYPQALEFAKRHELWLPMVPRS